MLSGQYLLGIADELVVDLFAGGGGASTGIEQAIGRHVDIAVNHDPEAVSMHQVKRAA
jgi:DNA (cytosine-5)-methyltransferase 1